MRPVVCVPEQARVLGRLVRDYLELEFQGAGALPFGFDLERVVDDFVLFCMLIGNDFLPGARARAPSCTCL